MCLKLWIERHILRTHINSSGSIVCPSYLILEAKQIHENVVSGLQKQKLVIPNSLLLKPVIKQLNQTVLLSILTCTLNDHSHTYSHRLVPDHYIKA